MYWGIQLFLTLKVIKDVPVLEKFPPRLPGQGTPKVSIIIAARNEKENVSRALKSRLESDYPDFEIIFIDDRSDDGTYEEAVELARADSRLKVVRVSFLPEGWLGKVNALNAGVKAASGEWLLFTDGDVYFSKDALSRAVSRAVENGLDHLAVIPELRGAGFLLDAGFSTFVRLMTLGAQRKAIENPESKAAAGIGAFNLARKSAFEKTPGFEWLRLEPIDDMGLGLMMKKFGGKSSIANGRGLVWTHFYGTMSQMFKGADKGVYPAFGFRLFPAVFISPLFLILETAPFVLIFISYPYMKASGVFLMALSLVSAVSVNRWMNRPVLPALFIPLGAVISFFVTIRAVILGTARGGIIWRDTFYPAALLRKYRRFNMLDNLF